MEVSGDSKRLADNTTLPQAKRAKQQRNFVDEISDADHEEDDDNDTSPQAFSPETGSLGAPSCSRDSLGASSRSCDSPSAPSYALRELEDISKVSSRQAKRRKEYLGHGRTEDEYKTILLTSYGAGAAQKLALLGAQGIISPGDSTAQIQDSTTCQKCRLLRLSCILGHLVTLDDVEFFSTTSGSYNLAHVQRNALRCRVCKFLRDCMRIEQACERLSKPKFITLSAAVFCGLRNKVGFVDAPCLVFASKKEDRYGCVLPISSSYRAGTITGRKIDPKQVDYDAISGWLSFCRGQHADVCQPKDTTRASHSLRCIDTSTRDIVHLSSAEPEYLTLSYVWGSAPAAADEDGSRMPTPAPKVIEDAMIVTKMLGFRFLWVDRYCIPQDDQSERHRQLKNMGHIYSRSVLTIVAAAGQGPDFGLPGVSSTPRVPQPSLCWGDDELVYCETKGIKGRVQASTWNTRGWTYQEGLLACRRLVFTEAQVYFQCQAMHQVETVSTQLNTVQVSKVFAISVDFGIVFPAFQELRRSQTSFINRVNEFVMRRLSYDSDALDAFQGILGLFADLPRPIHQLCGVPLFPSDTFVDPEEVTSMRKLIAGLSWRFDAPVTRRPEFPSWTWVGWKYSRSAGDGTASALRGSPGGHPGFRFIFPSSWMRGPSGDNNTFRKLEDIVSDVVIESRNGSYRGWDLSLLRSLTNGGRAADEPRYLHLTGLAFEVLMERQVPKERGKPGWKFQEPQGLRQCDSEFSVSSGDDSGMNPSGQRLWALIFGLEQSGTLEALRECSLGENCHHVNYTYDGLDMIKRNCHYKKDTRQTVLYLLLLKKRDGEAIFERVDCINCFISGHLSDADPENPQIGSLKLVRKRMRIG